MDAARLGADDLTGLTWSELADALWLTSVTRHAWQAHLTPEPPPEDSAQQNRTQSPVAAETTDSGIPPDREPDEDVKPPGFLLLRSPDTSDRRSDTASVLGADSGPSTDSGSVAPPVARPPRDAANIVRVLRPLKRRVPSWYKDEVILDEEATAERAVQDGLWLPVTRPDTTRLLELTLVVDASPSMALWRSTVKEVISLAEQLGAFRSIQLRLLDTEPPTSPLSAFQGLPNGARALHRGPVLHGGTMATPPRSPAELLNSSGRRILLVLTDGVGRCWREDLVAPLLAQWGAAMPVAVVHLLPQRLWSRGGLALHRARLTVPGPLRPNRRWELELPDAWLEPDPAAAVPSGAIPVPVLEWQARWLGWWAQLVTGGYRGPADAMVLLAGTIAKERVRQAVSLRGWAREPVGSTGGETSAQQRVRNFLSVASPAAFRLATLLAAVPMTVSLPVARLVQEHLVPESGLDHLVEVFTSELLRPSATTAGGRAWDTIAFDFLDGVRETLLTKARRAETAHVVRLVTERFGDQISTLRHFRDVLDDPINASDPQPTADTAHWVAIERTILRALSGPYLGTADQVRVDTVASDKPQAANTVASVGDGDTIIPVADRTDVVSEPTRSVTPSLGSPTHDGESLAEATSVGTPATRPGPLTGFTPVSAHERQVDAVPPIWGDVPPRNPNFTGRVELLQRLDERLTPGSATAVLPVPATLHGMGGVGKTLMAVEYIYRHLRDYDIIWWIQAAQPAQIRAGLTGLAQRLGLPGSSEAHTAVAAVREALRIGQPYRRWLLVFDAAEAPEEVRPFFPTNGPGEILVTSRNPDWAGIAHPLQVDVFTREESKELLRRRGREISDEEADRLAEVLGDLPLAIEQAAAWRVETGMPVAEYLRLFEEKRAEILDTPAPADYEVSVAAAWNVSFDALCTRSPAAYQLLQVCAFFAPEPISRSLFTGVRGMSISPELDAALRDPMRISRAIRDISRYGLAKIDHRNDTLQLHRLVKLALINRMTPQRSAEMRHGAHQLLANFDPNDPVSAKQWPRYQDILPHVYEAEVIACNDPWVRQLVVNLMEFLYRWGDHEEAARLARQAVDLWTEKLGEKDLQTLQAAGRLSSYLRVLGRYVEAKEITQHTLELYRQVSGENSEETVRTELDIVTDLRVSGDFSAALEMSEKIYLKAKGLFGEDDPTTLMAAHNLRGSLGLTGQYHRAQELGEDTYRRRAEVIGYDNPNTMRTLNGLNLARLEAGDYHGARVEQEQLVERLRELLGPDKAFTLQASYHLSVAKRKDGDHPDALELSAQVLERFRARYGDKHLGTMACALAKSIDLRHAGDLGSARKLGEQAFDLHCQDLGEHHPHTLSARLDLAVTLRLLGDAAGARQLDEQVLEQFRTMLGPEHPYAIVSAINLASDLAALGETKAALALGTEALDRANRVLGADHPTTLACLTNLVLDLRTLGRTQDAETKYAEVLTCYRRVLGDAHPATRAAASGQRADCDIDPLPL